MTVFEQRSAEGEESEVSAVHRGRRRMVKSPYLSEPQTAAVIKQWISTELTETLAITQKHLIRHGFKKSGSHLASEARVADMARSEGLVRPPEASAFHTSARWLPCLRVYPTIVFSVSSQGNDGTLRERERETVSAVCCTQPLVSPQLTSANFAMTAHLALLGARTHAHTHTHRLLNVRS